MTENKENPTHEQITPNHQVDEQEIDLMDILRKIIAIRKTLYKAAGIGLIIGVIVALSIPKQYTVKVTLSPEMGNSKGGNGLAGLAASFLGTGATMTDGMDALNASLSSDIVSSTPFLLDLSNMKVPTSNERMVTLSTYLDNLSYPWWNYIMEVPGVIFISVKSLLLNEEILAATDSIQSTIFLNKEKSEQIEYLKKNIKASVDKKTAITEISVTLQNPRVTAVVADSVVKKLQGVIIGYRTSKAKEDCIYLEKLFKERQKDYYAAQKKYANYVDSHDNLILQSVRAEQERLQNDMNLAYQVYSQVATQLQVAQAKVQEVKPVFAVVEPAVIPLSASGMGMKIYILLFVFLFITVAIIQGVIRKEFWNELKSGGKVRIF